MKRFAVLFFLGAFFLSACGTARWVRTPVLKQKNIIITLEQRQEKGKIIQQKFDHPYAINLPEFEKLLKDLTYIEQAGLIRKEKKSPVFQGVEIDRLAPAIADTLAKADASQRIRFTSFNRGKALIFSVSRETGGVIFIDSNGCLNIAFDFINSEINPNEASNLPPSFSQVDPLKIQHSDTTIIATSPYAELQQFENGEPAPMWIVADLEKLKEANNSAPVPITKKKEKMPPADVTPELGTAPAAQSISPEPVTQVIETEKTTPVKTSDEMLQQDIKNKLNYLKDLLNEGLISEKDYNTKKKELLDKIN